MKLERYDTEMKEWYPSFVGAGGWDWVIQMTMTPIRIVDSSGLVVREFHPAPWSKQRHVMVVQPF